MSNHQFSHTVNPPYEAYIGNHENGLMKTFLETVRKFSPSNAVSVKNDKRSLTCIAEDQGLHNLPTFSKVDKSVL